MNVVLKQTKLTKQEWESIERPVDPKELIILNMIYNRPMLRTNTASDDDTNENDCKCESQSNKKGIKGKGGIKGAGKKKEKGKGKEREKERVREKEREKEKEKEKEKDASMLLPYDTILSYLRLDNKSAATHEYIFYQYLANHVVQAYDAYNSRTNGQYPLLHIVTANKSSKHTVTEEHETELVILRESITQLKLNAADQTRLQTRVVQLQTYLTNALMVNNNGGSSSNKDKDKDKSLFDFVLLRQLLWLLQTFSTEITTATSWVHSYYTLSMLVANIPPNGLVNQFLLNNVIKPTLARINLFVTSSVATHRHIMRTLIYNAREWIECNDDIIDHQPLQLYNHQKQLFQKLDTQWIHWQKTKQIQPTIICYCASTSMGKTLTPLGIVGSNKLRKVLFVCGARHVGLALARSAISVNVRVGFAFGCTTATDIRLHNSAAATYTRNEQRHGGGIRKIDNSDCSKVDIMICDLQSYLVAMHAMRVANGTLDRVVMFWDEPLISMDYEDHALHSVIKTMWTYNEVRTVVLSSATLPSNEDMSVVFDKFEQLMRIAKAFQRSAALDDDDDVNNDDVIDDNDNVVVFDDDDDDDDDNSSIRIVNIRTTDYRKTIPLYNVHGHLIMPHHLLTDSLGKNVAATIRNNPTLLRYVDLCEAAHFMYEIDNNQGDELIEFIDVTDVTVESIKRHYLHVLSLVEDNVCTPPPVIAAACMAPSSVGPRITTVDAHTLTEGPTLFLTDQVWNVAQVLLKEANIPSIIMHHLEEILATNTVLTTKIAELELQQEEEENELLEKMMRDTVDTSTSSASVTIKATSSSNNKYTAAAKLANRASKGKSSMASESRRELAAQIEMYRSQIRPVAIDNIYVPNTTAHLEHWAPQIHSTTLQPFVSSLSEQDIHDILALSLPDQWKILALLGIGVFASSTSIVKPGAATDTAVDITSDVVTNNNHIIQYTEIISRLADNQQLYLIIADSDYIYGLNKQFCHGYIGKGMLKMTPYKIMQSIGRIGRHSLHGSYSVRFRDDSYVQMLYNTAGNDDKHLPEVRNINKLLG